MHYALQRRQHLELSVWILKYPSRWGCYRCQIAPFHGRSRIYSDSQSFDA
jgi:hypothetical protein